MALPPTAIVNLGGHEAGLARVNKLLALRLAAGRDVIFLRANLLNKIDNLDS